MNRLNLVVLFLLAPSLRAPLLAQEFKFSVRHQHSLRDCQGILKITAEGVEYQTSQAKDSRKWKFEEISTLRVESQNEISVVTYEDQKRFAGKDKVFHFTLLEGKATPEMSAYLLTRVKKPMVLAVLPESEKPRFEFAVKHLHVFAGALGVLRIYPDRIIFQTKLEGDSRIWRLADLERFSQPDRFRFEITSHVSKTGGPTESYYFQLMEDLPEGLYDYLWLRLHPSTYYPFVPR